MDELRELLIKFILTYGRRSILTIWVSEALDIEIVKEMKGENKYVNQQD